MPKPRLVVIGAGMAAQRLLERMVDRRIHRTHEIVVYGEESALPYDRIRIGQLIRGGKIEPLQFRELAWYRQHDVTLNLASRAISISRGEQLVELENGERVPYQTLVLATGSEPRIPPSMRADSERVLVYRSAVDAIRIGEAATKLTSKNKNVLIVGAGLLGLEVASDLLDLGLTVTVIDSSSHLLSRQLDVESAQILRVRLESLGLRLLTQRRIESVEACDERVEVKLNAASQLADEDVSDTELDVAFVVVAIGVRPRDALAREAGLNCSFRGGVLVDSSMQTEDPNIYAVGECASFDNEQVGLVAPCYDMAEALAATLANQAHAFRRNPTSTKLKVPQASVLVMGDAIIDGVGVRAHVHRDHDTYRRVVTREGEVVGAVSIGEWSDSPRVIERIVRKARLHEEEIARFEKGEPLFGDAADSIHDWADNVPVCNCTGATCGALRGAIRDGCGTLDALSVRTGAGTACGSCKPLLAQLLGVKPTLSLERGLVALSLVVISVLVIRAIGGAWPEPSSVEAVTPLDELHDDALAKQITGYTAAGAMLISLGVSIRKRIPTIRWGPIWAWRLFHASMGVLALAGVFAHTGFRIGYNLDRALALCFAGVITLGSSIAMSRLAGRFIEPTMVVRAERWLIRAHYLLFWPLPALVLFHALKTYFY